MSSSDAEDDFRSRVFSSFQRQGFMAHIEAHLTEVETGRCVIDVGFSPRLSQQHGYFHGGLIGTLIDNAGAYAAFTLISASDSMLTVEYKVNLVAPSSGQSLQAVGTVVRAGRTLTTSQVEVFAVSGADKSRCAIGLVTMMRLAKCSDG